MVSPFYQAEQERLYPHRKRTDTSQAVADHAKELIAKGIETRESLGNTRIGTLQHKYFLGADVTMLLIGLSLID